MWRPRTRISGGDGTDRGVLWFVTSCHNKAHKSLLPISSKQYMLCAQMAGPQSQRESSRSPTIGETFTHGAKGIFSRMRRRACSGDTYSVRPRWFREPHHNLPSPHVILVLEAILGLERLGIIRAPLPCHDAPGPLIVASHNENSTAHRLEHVQLCPRFPQQPGDAPCREAWRLGPGASPGR